MIAFQSKADDLRTCI